MPNNNVINTLSIEFEAEVKKALSSVDELVQRLTHLSHKVGEVRGLKLSLGIGAKTAENLKKFGEALDLLDLDKFKQFAEASQWVSKLNTGLSKDTGDNLLNFAVAIEQIDVGKLYDFGAATSTIQPMSFGVGEKTGQNLLAFADALDHINVDKMVMVSAANANFHALEGIGIGEKTGKNLASFASALNLVDIAKLREFSDIGGSFESISLGIGQATGKNFSAFAHALDELDIEKLRELAAIDFSNIAALGFAGYYIRGLGKELDRLEKVTRKATEAQKKFSSSTKGSGSSAKGLLGRLVSMAKRVVLLRMIRTALQSITNGLHEGIENLYYWSQAWGTSFAPAMDRLATAQQYLKNSFASMFSPLIEYAIPIIDRLIDKFVDFFNFVQEGFAQLTGAATWNRARKVPVQYADALDNASKSAKELKHQLLGFDELNVLNTPTDSSRGSNNDAKDYSSMFELVETAAGNNFESLGERLAKSLNSLFDDEEKWGEWGTNIATWITGAFDETLDFFRNVDWNQIGESFSAFISDFAEKIGQWIGEEDWGQDIVDLTQWIINFIDGIDFGRIIKALAKLVLKIVAAIPSILYGIAESFHRIMAKIFTWLRWDTFADFFTNMADRTANGRKAYEQIRQGTINPWIDSLFESAEDVGDAIDQSEEEIQKKAEEAFGSAQDQQGAAFGSNSQGDLFDNMFGSLSEEREVEVNIKTKLVEDKKGIDKAWEKVVDYWKSKKRELEIAFNADSIIEPVRLKWKDLIAWWGTASLTLGFKATSIVAPASRRWQELVAWWNNATLTLGFKATSLIEPALQRWRDLIAWWGTASLTLGFKAASIIEPVRKRWNDLIAWWGTASLSLGFRATSIIEPVWKRVQELTAWWGNAYLLLEIKASYRQDMLPDLWRRISTEWNNLNPTLTVKVQAETGTGSNLITTSTTHHGSGASFGSEYVAQDLAAKVSSVTLGLPLPVTKSLVSTGSAVAAALQKRMQLRGYASGGFTSPSTFFYAGENGVPELLGTIGGRSAVAGGAEITGIRDAIYAQAENETALFRQLIAAVNAKDLTLTANSTTGRWVNKALKAYSGVTG